MGPYSCAGSQELYVCSVLAGYLGCISNDVIVDEAAYEMAQHDGAQDSICKLEYFRFILQEAHTGDGGAL